MPEVVSMDVLAQNMLDYLNQLSIDSMKIPRSIAEDGSPHSTPSKSWTSGFFPGILWQLYQHGQQPELMEAAKTWQAFVEKEKFDSTTHDLGFKIYNSFGHAYKLTKEEEYKDVIIQAASTLITRYNPKVGALRSWDHNADKWDFPVIIDNMMNLELLFETSLLTEDSMYYDIALQHALTTLNNHFREDHSSYHVIDYFPETGEIRKKNTHQGYNDMSAWSRGQAWGLYGFTIAYRYTKDVRFLNKAKEIYSFIFNHPNLPEDLIPYWDYNAPSIPDEVRDVSAATVVASALFELSSYWPIESETMLKKANKILTNLNTPTYSTTQIPFFLKASCGSKPHESEVNVPIIYADYYYVEALLRKIQMENI